MNSVKRFQDALISADDERQFQHVPVDWWDAPARVWRPSVVESVFGMARHRTHADIVAPETDVVSVTAVTYKAKRVPIDELRPSQLLDEGIAQFFTTRYTLELMDSLMPCIDLACDEERIALHRVLDELLETYADSFELWQRAFVTGSDAASAEILPWCDGTVDMQRLSSQRSRNAGAEDLFSVIKEAAEMGGIDCAPVAMWDEAASCWRPTMLLDATGDAAQFLPGSIDRVLVPGLPVDVVTVPGSVLSPLDLTDTCFSLVALPVLARDCVRMHEALVSAGFADDEVASHPFMIAFMKMLSGAADEWRGFYEEGLVGAAPEPRITPLPPALWGLDYETSVEATGDGWR